MERGNDFDACPGDPPRDGATTFPHRTHGEPFDSGRRRCSIRCVVLFCLIACMVALANYGGDLALFLLPADCLPGIGDVFQAESRIHANMTRDEVLSLLGRPHRREQTRRPREGEPEDWEEWDYRGDFLGGSCLRVHFNEAGRVTYCEAWHN